MNAAEVKELEEIVRSLREGAKHGGSSVEWGLVQGAHAIEAFLARHSEREAAESERDTTCASCERPVCGRDGCGVYSEVGQSLCARCYEQSLTRPQPGTLGSLRRDR